MKKLFYFIPVAACMLAVLFIVFRHQAKEKNKASRVYYLLERKGSSGFLPEWETVRSQAAALLNKLQSNPGDISSMLSLANLYLQEARTTGNHLYYDKAAMKSVNDVLKRDQNNFEALSLKATILLSEHHFTEALALATQAVDINPYNAFVYGILVDGYVETGNYQAAVENLEKMIAIRPDSRSYARVSYLREIHGDFPGAIEAMKLAVGAGAPGDESTAWTRAQLGELYEKTGDFKSAEMHYLIALDERKGYAYALAGVARIAAINKEYKHAIALYQQADSSIHDYSIKEELSEVYRLSGQHEKASAMDRAIVEAMLATTNKRMADDSIGHYSDRELAYAYLKANENNKALEHALAEYNRRPDNIDVNETVAWVYYLRGDYAKALPYLKAALKTNSKNPNLLCRAGLIYNKNGNFTIARKLLQEVVAGNANISPDLKSEGIKALQAL